MVKIYNEEGRLVANDENSILDLLYECGYIIDPPEKEMKKLRIEHGVDEANGWLEYEVVSGWFDK